MVLATLLSSSQVLKCEQQKIELYFFQSLQLELRGNACGLECVVKIRNLIARKVIKSLTLPEGLDEVCTAEIMCELLLAQSPV